MWFKVFADGTEIDIVCAATADAAISSVKAACLLNNESVAGVHWTAKLYG